MIWSLRGNEALAHMRGNAHLAAVIELEGVIQTYKQLVDTIWSTRSIVSQNKWVITLITDTVRFLSQKPQCDLFYFRWYVFSSFRSKLTESF